MLKKKSWLKVIVPAFVTIAYTYIGIEATGSLFWSIGEPKLPAKFDQ